MKKITLAIVLGVFLLFLTGCDGVLSVVTVNENGEKVFHNFVSLMDDTVYDTTVTMKNWQDLEELLNNELLSEELLFTIVSNKDNIIVLGTAEYALEIKFFEGGYKYTAYMSADGLSNAFNF